MTPELKCPLGCGITLEQVGPHNPLWRHGRTMAPAVHRYCILESRTGTIEEWTARRTPDLTEALARLKALEEEIKENDERVLREVERMYPLMEERHYPTYFRWHKKWADEIAAIRKALGASDAKPKPAPES